MKNIKLDIKSVIDEQGTQIDFSRKTGIAPNRVSSLYHGVTMIRLKTISMILTAFPNLDLNDLFVIETE